MKHEWLNISDISELKIGDVVRGKSSGRVFIVTGNYGNRVTAVMSQDITNADEWQLLEYTIDVPPNAKT